KPESLELLRHSPLPYSLFVVTGRTPNVRVHGYHELVAAIHNMPLWRQRQEAERNYCHGDSVIDPPRIMRLAGTINYPRHTKPREAIRQSWSNCIAQRPDRSPTPTSTLAGLAPATRKSNLSKKGQFPISVRTRSATGWPGSTPTITGTIARVIWSP